MQSFEKFQNKVVVFTDGSSRGNPGPGGWGSLIISPDLDELIELGGSSVQTTNNEMELLAVISALSYLIHNNQELVVFSDSSYVLQGVQSWMYGWIKRDWKKQDGEEIQHRFHWENLYQLVQERGPSSITWQHVPGHVGVAGNERVDSIAHGFASGQNPELYRGTFSGYGNSDILTIEIDDTSVTKKKHSKQTAFIYLSVVDGVLQRHQTWDETQKRVHGTKADYRKAISAEHEQEIIAEWKKKGVL